MYEYARLEIVFRRARSLSPQTERCDREKNIVRSYNIVILSPLATVFLISENLDLLVTISLQQPTIYKNDANMTTTTTTTPQHFLIGKEMNGSIVVDVVEEITPVRKHYVKVKRTIRLKNGVESWKEFLRDENYTPEQELQDWERQQAYLQRKKEQAAKRQQEAQEKALKDEEKKSSKASLIAKSPISKPTKDFLESAMGSFNLEQLLTNQMEEHEFSDKRAYKSMSSIADAQMNPGKNQVNTRKDPLGYRLSAPEPKPRGLQATELHLQKLLEVEVEAEEEEGYHIDKERISEREENQEILTAEKVEAEQLATPKKVTESGRMAAEQLAAEKVAEAEEGRIAAEKPHPEKIPAEKALQAEKLAAEPSAAKSEAEQQLLERKKHEAERLAAEKATAEKIDAERQNAQLFAVEKTERERIAAEITALRKAEAERTAAETKSSTEEGDDKTEDRPDDEQEVYEMKAAVEQLATDTDASELEDQEDPKPSSFKRKKKKRDEKKSTSKERKSKRKSTSRGRKKKTDDGDSSVEEEKSNRKSTSRGRKKKTGDDDSSTEDKKSKRKSTSRGTKKRTEDDDSSVEDEKSKRTSTSRGRKKKIEDSSSSVGSKRKSTSRGKRKTRKGTKKEHTNNENKRVSEVLHPSDPNDSDVSIDADKLFPQQYESSSEHVEHASADMSGSITGSSAILYNSTVSSANLSLSAEVESETIAGPPKSESIHTPAVSGKANLNSDSPGFSKISSPFFPKSPAFSELMGVWVARESKTSVYKTTLDAVQKTGGESPESPTLESMVRKWEAKGAGETTVRKDPPNKLKKTQAPKLPNLDIPFEPPAFQKSVEERKLVEKTVEENRLFKDLTPAGKAPILDAFERKVYKKGETIGEEGEAENCYSIVQSGTVKFHSHGKEVGSAGVGESFGEIGLLYPSARAVTIEAAERHTVLLQLDHAHFRRIVKEEMMRAEKAKLELLKAVPTFKGLDEVELRHLGHAMVALPFKKGENLSKAFRKRAFCLVQQSSIEVKHPRPQPGTSKKPKKVVTALADGLAFTIDHEAFAKVFGNYNRESFKKDDKEILVSTLSDDLCCKWTLDLITFLSSYSLRLCL